jgi:hypothetical protein
MINPTIDLGIDRPAVSDFSRGLQTGGHYSECVTVSGDAAPRLTAPAERAAAVSAATLNIASEPSGAITALVAMPTAMVVASNQ